MELDSRYKADLASGASTRQATKKLKQRMRAAAHRDNLNKAEAVQRAQLLTYREAAHLKEEPEKDENKRHHDHIEEDQDRSDTPVVKRPRAGKSKTEQEARRKEHAFEMPAGFGTASTASVTRVGAREEREHPNPNPRTWESARSEKDTKRDKERRKKRRAQAREAKRMVKTKHAKKGKKKGASRGKGFGSGTNVYTEM